MKKLVLFFLLFVLLAPLCSFAANNGIPYGGVTFGHPKFGGASASFDGVDDYLLIPADSSLDFGKGNFTLEFWVKTTLNTGSIISKNLDSVPGYFELGLENGSVYFYAEDVELSHGVFVETTAKVIDDTWHYVVFVRAGSFFQLWVDGVLDANVDDKIFGSLVSSTGATVGVGFWVWIYQGLLDELAVYDSALSFTTITSHYNSTLADYQALVSADKALISYWRFDNDFLDASVSLQSFTDSELLQQIKDVLDQIDAKTQAIKDVTAGSTAVDWNKTMSFVVGTFSSLAFVFASRMIL